MAHQPFDDLPRAGFAGFEFPVSHIEVIGGLRDHVHEYPHSPGGAPEKLGRKLYEVHYSCPMYQGSKLYPLLWPETVASLRIIFEGGNSFDLVIPTIGTITAYCTSWREVADTKKARNGVTYDLVFREDDSNLFLVDKLITQTTASFSSSVAAYNAALQDQIDGPDDAEALVDEPDALMLEAPSGNDLQTLQQIGSDASSVLGAVTAALSFGDTIASAALALASLCADADANVAYLNMPTAWPLLYALEALWVQAIQLSQDALQTGFEVIYYTVPAGTTMSVSAISTAIYGDASEAVTIMQTNALENPFAVPGGTVVKAYVAVSTTTQNAA